MINHARTLVLNHATTSLHPIGVDGTEYVDPAFSPIQLAPEAERIRTALLGSAGDHLFENRMLSQLFSAVHSYEVTEGFILRPDNRVTYRFDQLVSPLHVWDVTRVSGSVDPVISGAPVETDRGLSQIDGILVREGGVLSLSSPTFTRKARGSRIEVMGTEIVAPSDGEWRVRLVAPAGHGIVRAISTVEALPSSCDVFLRAGDSEMLELWLRGQTQVSRAAGLVCLYLSCISGDFANV